MFYECIEQLITEMNSEITEGGYLEGFSSIKFGERNELLPNNAFPCLFVTFDTGQNSYSSPKLEFEFTLIFYVHSIRKDYTDSVKEISELIFKDGKGLVPYLCKKSPIKAGSRIFKAKLGEYQIGSGTDEGRNTCLLRLPVKFITWVNI